MKTFYGIRNKESKVPLGFCSTSNEGGEFCVSVEFTLDSYDCCDNVWLVSRKDVAEKVLRGDTPWYNAGYESPRWPGSFNPGKYEVFEVSI